MAHKYGRKRIVQALTQAEILGDPLVRLYNSGMSMGGISDRTGKNVGTISQYLKSRGIRPLRAQGKRLLSADEADERPSARKLPYGIIMRLYQGGMSSVMIARQIGGTTPASIIYALKACGVPIRSHKDAAKMRQKREADETSQGCITSGK